eukprot:s2118_g9.t1
MDLRDEPKASVDHVWKEIRYQVLAIEADTRQLMLDQDIFLQFDSVWYHDGCPVQVSQIDGALCTVHTIDSFEIEDEFVQRIFISDVNDVLDSFTQHWQPRWNLFTQLPDEVWDRVTKFTAAHMPTLQFQLPTLDAEIWPKTVSKFRPRAARGPDGFSKQDLKFLPNSFLDELLELFRCIEDTDLAWPAQLRLGTVIATAKCKQAHEEHQYRPITLFSMLLRTWSKLRTRQMLQQLAEVMPTEALGFLPHREAAESWLLLQGQIEVMLTMDEPYCGLSSDVRRAFNHIGRRQVFHLSAHLGFPAGLLNAWQKFLASFQRCFEIQGCVGPLMKSDSGFPEGDPLSIIAMLCVNWGYHVYMKHYVPKVQAFSFVDNLTLAAKEAILVIQGYFAMVAFHEMFGLSLDTEKTFVWGLTTALRKSLSQLGFSCLYDATELGASMSYGAKIRNRFLKARGTGLEDKWQKLRRSMAPLTQKFSVLSTVFWPKALHGAPACVFADNYLLALRRAATKALKINGAGANPTLRLSLSSSMRNDPGFFQIQYCIQTFRRLAHKHADLVPMWRTWQRLFDGRQHPGPFTKLLICLNQLGWRVLEPPLVCDHEQHTWNLVTMDSKTLESLLTDGWSQYIAAHVNHKTMHDLDGLDYHLTMLDYDCLLPVECSLLSALHAGAFISASEHAKYDHAKVHICEVCQLEDDRSQWLVCPRFQTLRQSIEGWFPDNVELPMCLTHHLLVPRLLALPRWRDSLLQIQDSEKGFLFYPHNKEIQHVFTDGACSMPSHPILRLASWGAISATSGELIAVDFLPGITQTIDRAELYAIVKVLQWTTDTDLCIWSDSQSTVTMATHLQEHGTFPGSAENYDLWLLLQDALQLRCGCTTWFRWVPSHICTSRADDEFEAWLFKWNNIIDDIVTTWNHARPPGFRAQHERLEHTLNWWGLRVRQLRTFYFKVAEHQLRSAQSHSSLAEIVEIESDDECLRSIELIADQLPLNWQVSCRQMHGRIPGCFVESFLQWLCAMEQLENQPICISEIELVFALCGDPSFCFPFQLDGSTNWSMRRLADLFQKPTLAALLRPIQWTLQHLAKLFPGAIQRTPPKPAIQQILVQAREQLVRFTSSRGVRRASDLARPWT